MKRIFYFLTILFIVVSCNKYNGDNFICDCGKIEIDKKEYIAMCVIPQEVTINSGSYLRMENHTNKNMSYGEDFYMEYFNKNQWEPIYFDFYFTAIGRNTKAGEKTVGLMNLYSLAEEYNNACEGKYRIIKDVSLSIGQYNRHDLIAEFELIRHESLEISLTSTKWKFVCFVDAVTGEMKRAEPFATMYNFLIFNEDKILSGFSSSNELYGNYEIDTSTCGISIDIQAMSEVVECLDGSLFVELLNKVDFFSLQKHELRLYYNNKQNYLLLKPRKL